ncbi:transmembrane protein, putative (macronuclear) [Tetrahymena thermophila SB210]|uniref:Transmembrane protein, putative n=1 Tax=Tetrahymena thermophila (strain SB210) TaxID=312017 RepID=Q239S3_TETTS|nr:transmembrane protein, putative [Tetrahymena thermophila SB210]EAR93273.1 transmembrane protein, putative [Tetrahymena thermophila SB210]|eukprot:XP_001013518.1 transmembrane protein, putative [Tetrahymena thermophila SB210]
MQLEKLGAVCYKIKQKRIQQVFWIIFEAKKLISVAFILILPNKTIALSIDLILSSGFTIYIIIAKPLAQQNQNLMILVQEIISFLAKLIQTILISELEISFTSFSALLKRKFLPPQSSKNSFFLETNNF